MWFVLLVASVVQLAPSSVPDGVALPALAHEITRWPVDRIACVDVRGHPSPKQFIARIDAPGHTIVALGECTWATDGVTSGASRAFNVLLTNFTRISNQSVQITVSWYESMSESGEETLVLMREKGAWRVTGSLGRSVR